ncbi:unnamed protein product [Durusdinium trenchii]|uniref:Uncharacterized protein n=1 Tax=Durusdinium trenchii TaxID=1381693 RepID=A0ABP0L744_9DINO
METNQPTPEDFYNLLKEFVTFLHKNCPSDGVAQAESALDMMSLSLLHGMMVDKWYETASPILKDIMARQTGPVVAAFDNCSIKVIANIGAGAILENDATPEAVKESIWLYLDRLTATSVAIKQPSAVRAPAPTPSNSPQPTTKPAAINNIIKGVTESLPQVISGLNEVLKQNGVDSENPVGDFIKQMMNPQAMQPGMANNMMALATGQGQESPAMAEAASMMDTDVADIQRKLKKLKKLEEQIARKQQQK